MTRLFPINNRSLFCALHFDNSTLQVSDESFEDTNILIKAKANACLSH